MRFGILTGPIGVLLLAVVEVPVAAQSPVGQNWYRCNTHTHTDWNDAGPSDVNAPPETVAEWYRDHGYQCLVITDHEHLTDVTPLNETLAKDGEFLVIQGQEITQFVPDPSRSGGQRHSHVSGIGVDRMIPPMGYSETGRYEPPEGVSLVQTYERNIDAVYAAGGIAQVNHPNLMWSVEPGDLLPLARPFLLEIWNAFPTSNNLGGIDEAGHTGLSAEALWDVLLSRGKVVWGVASDDAHEYVRFDDREAPTPGKAWIVVQAPALTRDNMMDALRGGRFYASTGINVSTYVANERGISMELERLPEWSPSLAPSARYTTRFIGAGGKVLAEVPGMNPSYRFRGGERYVRASIVDSDGRRAWTQPVFLDGRKTARWVDP